MAVVERVTDILPAQRIHCRHQAVLALGELQRLLQDSPGHLLHVRLGRNQWGRKIGNGFINRQLPTQRLLSLLSGGDIGCNADHALELSSDYRKSHARLPT